MTELIGALVTAFLRWAQNKLYTTPQRDWSQIGWLQQTGRLVLILVALAIVLLPLGWLVFG